MEKYIESIELAELAGIKHRSLKKLINFHSLELSSISPLDRLLKQTTSGQNMAYYRLTRDQVSLLCGRMNRKTNRKAIRDYYSLDVMVVKNRLEYYVFETVKSIIAGFENKLTIECDFKIGSFRVDMAVFIGSVSFENILLIIEYDENDHKYNEPQDIKREYKIFKYLTMQDISIESFHIIRIKEGEEFEGYSNIVRFLNSEITNLSGSDIDCLDRFEFTI